MKTTPAILLLAALSLSSCDKAKEMSAEAKVQAAEAMDKAEAASAQAAEKTKEASSDIFNKTKELAGAAVKKSKELGGEAMDFTKDKLGIPETDGLIEGLGDIFAEARADVKSGKLKEKSVELKAKWDALYAKAEADMASMAPEKKEKLKAILASIKAKWDELFASDSPAK